MLSPCLATVQACHQGGLQRVCAHEAGGRAVSRNQCPSACTCGRDTYNRYHPSPTPNTMLCDTVCISPLASIQSRIEAASDAHLLHPSYPRLPYRDVSLCSALHTLGFDWFLGVSMNQ